MRTTGTSKLSGPDSLRRKRAQRAFSLVEVTLAIGIVAFAFIGVFGLIPTGLNVFREAMMTSGQSQIIQKVLNDVQQTDFTTLTNSQPQMRYFDDQGNEVTGSAIGVYQVNTRITPATVMPCAGTQPAESRNTNLATATIQVAYNPGNQSLVLSAGNIWTGALLSNPSNTKAVPIVSFSAMISRNQ